MIILVPKVPKIPKVPKVPKSHFMIFMGLFHTQSYPLSPWDRPATPKDVQTSDSGLAHWTRCSMFTLFTLVRVLGWLGMGNGKWMHFQCGWNILIQFT